MHALVATPLLPENVRPGPSVTAHLEVLLPGATDLVLINALPFLVLKAIRLLHSRSMTP